MVGSSKIQKKVVLYSLVFYLISMNKTTIIKVEVQNHPIEHFSGDSERKINAEVVRFTVVVLILSDSVAAITREVVAGEVSLIPRHALYGCSSSCPRYPWSCSHPIHYF